MRTREDVRISTRILVRNQLSGAVKTVCWFGVKLCIQIKS